VEKYFGWGVHTETLLVQNYDEKSAAIERLKTVAQVAGYRGPVRERILGVADELLMNALYHAPVDTRGKPLYKDMPRGEVSRVPLAAPVTVQYASDGKSFAVGVRDRFGSVSRDVLTNYLTRAAAGQAEIEQKTSGAGLGLATVLRSSSRLVFNLTPGASLEVIALFEYELSANHARAMHLFSSNRPLGNTGQQPAYTGPADLVAASAMASNGSAYDSYEAVAHTPPRSRAGAVLATAVITTGLLAGGGYAARDEVLPLVAPPELAVSSEPAGAEILLDGKRTGRVTPATLALAQGVRRLALRLPGFDEVSLGLAGQAARTTLRMTLVPSRTAAVTGPGGAAGTLTAGGPAAAAGGAGAGTSPAGASEGATVASPATGSGAGGAARTPPRAPALNKPEAGGAIPRPPVAGQRPAARRPPQRPQAAPPTRPVRWRKPAGSSGEAAARPEDLPPPTPKPSTP
jgi:hypothetical protein